MDITDVVEQCPLVQKFSHNQEGICTNAAKHNHCSIQNTHIHTHNRKKKRRTTEMIKSETTLVNKKSTWSFLALSGLMNHLALSPLSLSPVSPSLSRFLSWSLSSLFLCYLPFSCGLRLIMSSASALNSSSCAGPTFFNCLIATVDILILFKTGGRSEQK